MTAPDRDPSSLPASGWEPSLEDVLRAYAAAADGPSSSALGDWTRRYPQYARELEEFAETWALSRWLPAAPEAASVDEARLIERGVDIVRGLRARHAAAPRPAIQGLLSEAKQRGLTIQQLAVRAGLGVILVRKLDRRLIRFASIPREAIDALAAALGREASAVASYLQGGATFAAAASHLAEEAPRLAEPEDFFAAVRADTTMPDERRRAWLRLAPPASES
jgi:transcriptional regulator with XRE-family HTH domain